MRKTTLFTFLIIALTSLKAQQWDSLPKLYSGTDTVTNVYEIDYYGSAVFYSTDKGLFRSTDDGTTWSNLTWTNGVAANQKITNVFVDNVSNDIYISSDSSIYRSTNNGSTWNTTIINGTLKYINSISKIGSNILVAHGNWQGGGVYYTNNNLASFQVATIPNIEIRHFLIDGNDCYVTGKDGVYKSTDNGVTWTLSGTGFAIGSKYGKIIKEGNRILVADLFGNGLFKSDDNGATWANVDTTTYNGFCQVFDLAQLNGKVLSTVSGACNNSAPIKSSTNAGNSWSSFMHNLSTSFYRNLGASPSCFFTFDENANVPYRYCFTSTGIDNAEMTNNIRLYPNPTKGVINIENHASEIINVSVIDLTGKTIRHQLINNAIDMTDYNAGIYFIKIQTKKSIITQQIVKQ